MNSRIALLLLVCLVLPVSIYAAKDYTDLTIAVVDQKDRPVPRAAVTVTFVSGKKMFVKKVKAEWNTKTSSKGTAELPDIPSGKVRVQVICAGYQTYGEEFEISGDQMTHTIKLERPKGQYSVHEEPQPEPEKKKP